MAAYRGGGPRGLPQPAGTAAALTLKLGCTKVRNGPKAPSHMPSVASSQARDSTSWYSLAR
jgi:hypothetical protein